MFIEGSTLKSPRKENHSKYLGKGEGTATMAESGSLTRQLTLSQSNIKNFSNQKLINADDGGFKYSDASKSMMSEELGDEIQGRRQKDVIKSLAQNKQIEQHMDSPIREAEVEEEYSESIKDTRECAPE
mmetsp:Transcript_1510/g.2674  ORF Transcript_1510/g.2674 Transcript_1510/m.2674 type:complete len:129 (+) Transcript_1510:223-609(+)